MNRPGEAGTLIGMQAPAGRKDPTTAVILSLCFPGAGFAYLGDVGRFIKTAMVVGVLYCWFGNGSSSVIIPIGVHLFTAITAGGAARLINERLDGAIPPPPPIARRTDAAAGWQSAIRQDGPPPPPPPPPPPRRAPVAEGPQITPDDFIAEVREAWTAHRAGDMDEATYAERKRSAIERVRAADVDEGIALLEATSALVGAGVMTPAERTRLQLRVTRR